MKTYIAVVSQDTGSAFGVCFPDVPGCFSGADEEADILRNAIQALSLHFDGQTLPEARGVDQIARDAEVAEMLQSGSWLLAVPFVTLANRKVRANISLDKGILDAIDDASALRGLTRSAFIAEAVTNEIEGR